MELFVLNNGFPHIPTLPNPFLCSKFPRKAFSPPPRAPKISQLAAGSAAALGAEQRSKPPDGRESSRRRRHSKPYLQRQSAIRDVQQSRDLNSALGRHGEVLQVQDVNAILRHFGSLSRWQDLSQLFEWMQQKGKINAASYTSFIKLMGNSLNPVKALEIYNSIQDDSTRNNAFICNSLLRCLVRNDKLNSSFKLFHQMKQNGLTPDAMTYSSLLTGCMRTKDGYSKALELVQEMKRNELQMDGVIYGSLLAVCAANYQCEEAEIYFNQMKDEGHSPNEFHYSSLLNAYSTIGDFKKADVLVQDMKSAGLIPNKVILTTLLKVYVRGHMFDKARELLTELENLGYAKDEMPYCSLMDGLAKAGHIDEAKSVFEEMKEKSVESGGYSHSIMISAFCRGGLVEEATQLARDFETKYGKYDLVMINTMLNAYCRAGEMDSVMQMLKKMDESAIVPDYNTFKILIKYYCKEKLYLLAYRVVEDMHRNGYQAEEGLCSSLIFHLGKTKAHSEAFSVYNMLRYSKRTMCKAQHEKILHILVAGKLLRDAYVVVKDYATFISKPAKRKFARVFMKSGNINLINDVMKAIHSPDFKIDDEIFQMAISRYIAEPEKKELFLQLLLWMPGQGYFVDSSTRNEILKNSHLFGHQLIAEALAKQYKVMAKTLR